MEDSVKIILAALILIGTAACLYLRRVKNPPNHLRGGESMSFTDD